MRGDWEAAEAHRKMAELTTLESGATGMFDWTMVEWPIHALVRNFAGLQASREQLRALAASCPGWVPEKLALEAHYQHLRENSTAALLAINTLRPLTASSSSVPPAWYRAVEVEVAILVETGLPDLALERGLAALSLGDLSNKRFLRLGLSLEIALAEAALGRHDAARGRIQEEIAWQREAGVSGLLLGRSYEYLARAALVREDQEDFERVAALVAKEYGAESGSMLATRHHALLEEAERLHARTQGLARPEAATEEEEAVSSLLSELSTRGGADALAREGLALLCEAHEASGGALFLLAGDELVVAASIGKLTNPEVLKTFAKNQIEMELDDGLCTQTQDSMNEPQPVESEQGCDSD